MKKKPSLKDIAESVGVSTATVSYVLSKGKNSRISVEMSEKIRKVAKELNYHPNQIAKSLKTGKTLTIGLVVADISNPFFANLARIIEDEAAKMKYTVIFGSSDENPVKSLHLIQYLTDRQVDGFIIAPTENSEDQIAELKKQGVPFVLIDRCFPDIGTNYVIVDNFKASYDAVARLATTGNERIGMIAYKSGLYHMKERMRGYQAVLDNRKLTFQDKWLGKIDFANIEKDIKLAMDGMLLGKNPVTAIFFATNSLAIYGLKYLEELKLSVPEDVSVVSFDESLAFDFYYCPLTHIEQPLREMGKNAVKILMDQISNPGRKEKQICLGANLVIGKSCGNRKELMVVN